MSVGDTIQRQMPATVDSPARMGEPNAETIQPTGVKAVNGVNGHSNGHSNSIDLAEYLFRRLYELGIRSVHGLPGDYNLVGEQLSFKFSSRVLTPSSTSGFLRA